MMLFRKNVLWLALLSLLLTSHDYWFSAEKFILKKGDTLTLHLLVGDDLNAEEERVVQRYKTINYALHTAAGAENLLPAMQDSTLPILHKQLNFNGLGLISMERNFSRITLVDSMFHRYLIHEYQIDAMDTREKPGRKHARERERYARSLKVLVQVGQPNSADRTFARRLGHRIEIIPGQNPYLMKPGNLLEAQLLFEGKPMLKKVIMALHKEPDGKFTELITYTDEQGFARFKLPYRGAWVLRTTHLRPCQNCPDADWESFWTAFSFAIP
ncbi:MAG: DUF4198 domain-containing protein [Cytophagaceae bacterium]|nr:DUF4198 domain-containing protein [Cytophagaceae bacterium]